MKSEITKIKGGIATPKGFKAAGVVCGLKSKGEDLAVIASDTPATAAAVFTRNQVCAAPIHVSRRHLRRGPIRAIVVNSGNANACTGESGMIHAREMAEQVGEKIGVPSSQVLVASTGVIGHPLDMDKVRRGIGLACTQLSRKGGPAASRAIMTTDLVPKTAARRFQSGRNRKEITLGGMAKGSGMIHPQLATMLAFLTTDAAIDTRCLRRALRHAVDETFNMITVDGDTSTNDAVMLLAGGGAENPMIDRPNSSAYLQFQSALTDLCRDLAIRIVQDGEGATHLIRIEVEGARTQKDAREVAKSIASSNLVKTAIFGQDPNWGRILCAAGYSSGRIDPSRLNLWIGNYPILHHGEIRPDYRGKDLEVEMKKKEVLIRIGLEMGKASATAWTCDLTYDYIRINAEYHT